MAADGTGSASRLHEILLDQGLDFAIARSGAAAKPGGTIVVAPLHRGCTLPNAKLAVVAESDLTGRRRAHRTARPRRREGTTTFEDLKTGNYVVHHQHGVGHFEGMVKRTIGGVERDYLLVAYKGDDKLYVPSDQIDTIRQYIGGEAPTLHRIGGSDFAKAKGRVRSAVREIAQELVVLYQTRVNAEGHAFGIDTPWQREMEDAFPFEETPDQLTAIEDVKSDMERPTRWTGWSAATSASARPRSRCGRPSRRSRTASRSPCWRPTTLLAQQHGDTFAERFAGYPIRVEVLSPLPHGGPGQEGDRGPRATARSTS